MALDLFEDLRGGTQKEKKKYSRVPLERALWPPGRPARGSGERFPLPYLLPLWQSAPGATWVEEGAVMQVA